MEDLIYKIIKKPTKKGVNYYFNIPIDYIRTKKINPDEEYEILVFKLKNPPE